MKSIFVFKKNGDYIEELKQEEGPVSSAAIKDIADRQFFLREEQTEKTEKGITRITFKTPQSPKDERYIWAVFEELRTQKFRPYVFEGEKRDMARLLIKAPLTSAERLEFFDNLTAVSDSEVTKLKKGLEEDLQKIC